MAFLARAVATASGVQQLMNELRTARNPTIQYQIQCPDGMKMKMVDFYMCENILKRFDAAKFNDTEEHELGGTTLAVCGSGYAMFYSEQYDMGVILAFSNPDVGSNKIDGELVQGMPERSQADIIWNRMSDHYGSEAHVSSLGPVNMFVKNERGEPARGYYRMA